MKGIVLDIETGDLQPGAKGLVIGEVEQQSAALVITAWRGELKERPLVGGEAHGLRGATVDVMWAGRVKRMLRGCSIECERVEVGADGVVIIE